ncbi:hypothetical protein BpHYR1_039357 [Brachionus plicatilis]|uniref:Uncharacterized protein n=1 Tax=Brachionus plicatilis TaxID=10195 RepID=A0A3M7QXR8_BRAPC|nr:hypothetical protein BpHYR1_039357 [Brachionus plicatilis]
MGYCGTALFVVSFFIGNPIFNYIMRWYKRQKFHIFVTLTFVRASVIIRRGFSAVSLPRSFISQDPFHVDSIDNLEVSFTDSIELSSELNMVTVKYGDCLSFKIHKFKLYSIIKFTINIEPYDVGKCHIAVCNWFSLIIYNVEGRNGSKL